LIWPGFTVSVKPGTSHDNDEADKGGHFAALEQPEILVSEIRDGLRSLRV
jgi:hypothetical protein